jgi:hypothetical protein
MGKVDFEVYTAFKVGEDGKFIVPAHFVSEVKKYFKDTNVEFICRRKRSHRSDKQNRLWWLYMTILSNEIGYTKEEIHEICKFKFLKREKVDETTGEVLEYLGSTAKLNKSDFADMTSDLIQWAAETFKIVLPMPGEQTELIK